MGWEGLNRRNFPRVIFPCLVKIQSGQDAWEPVLTHTENMGGGGICVTVKHELKMFSTVKLELDLLDGHEHLKTEGRVVWSVRRKSDQDRKPMFYDVGIEFVGLTNKDKERLKQLLDQMLLRGAKLLRPII